MNIEKALECERNSFQRFAGFLILPNYFKKVGIIFATFTFILLFCLGFATEANESLKLILKNLILVSLLAAVLSKEVIEDEFVEKLRGQAFTFAFITGVGFALFQPYVNYIAAALIKPEKAVFEQMGDFVILWFMLIVYLAFFYLLKRTS